MEKLIKLSELAEMMRVSKRTIYNLIYTGRLPAKKFFGSLRFSQDDIKPFLKRKEFKKKL